MPRCETRWLINEGALTFTRKIFHRAQKFSFISCLLRARISVKELRSQNIEYELRRLSAAVEFQCLSCIFGVDPVKRLLWGAQVCMLRLSPSILWFMITARTWMWSSWVFSVKSLQVLRSVCLGLPSVRSSHNLSARLQWKLQLSWENMNR